MPKLIKTTKGESHRISPLETTITHQRPSTSWQVVQTETIRTFPAELMAPETIKAQLPNSCFIGKKHMEDFVGI